jgi:hypothetical protein
MERVPLAANLLLGHSFYVRALPYCVSVLGLSSASQAP